MNDEDADRERLQMQAFRALRGASETPERDLAALLRSSHAIDPELRRMMADALQGSDRKNRTIGLVTQAIPDAGAHTRSMGKRFKSLERGKEARRLKSDGDSYEAALEKVAVAWGVEVKTVGRDYTLANKIAAWATRQGNRAAELGCPAGNGVSLLEALYLKALAEKAEPTEYLQRWLDDAETADLEWRDELNR